MSNHQGIETKFVQEPEPYFHTHHPLPEVLLDLLASILHKLTCDIKSLESRNLPEDQEMFSKLRDGHVRLRSLRSAVRTSPPEIIAMILQSALDDDKPLERNGRLWSFRLKAVCSLWIKLHCRHQFCEMQFPSPTMAGG